MIIYSIKNELKWNILISMLMLLIIEMIQLLLNELMFIIENDWISTKCTTTYRLIHFGYFLFKTNKHFIQINFIVNLNLNDNYSMNSFYF